MHTHEHSHKINSLSTAFIVGTLLNLAFVIVEATAGYMSNSMGLLSDAGHNLSDTVSLLLAWIAFSMTRKQANKRYTYGYSKSTVLASLINAAILLVAVGMIVLESIKKFSNPQPINEDAIIWVASVGIVINLATALMFMRDRKKDLNIQGAFLHMAMDTLVSVGVVVSGLVIKFTGLTIIDPIIGLVIAGVIFFSTFGLLKESVRLSLDAVPASINIDKVRAAILKVSGVDSIHHLHIWALGTSKNALTVHVIVSDFDKCDDVKDEIRHILEHMNIAHATIETEPVGVLCGAEEC